MQRKPKAVIQLFLAALFMLMGGLVSESARGQSATQNPTTPTEQAQGPNGTGSSPTGQPRPFRPDVTFVIRKHSTGADLLEVSLLSPNYRATEFARRLQLLGQLLGSEARGLNVFVQDMTPKAAKPGDPKLLFMKATFATDGILNGNAGIRLKPLVQAFAGGSGAEEVKALEIVLSGERATPGTVRHFASAAVEVEGQAVLQPPMLDYRIWLLSQKAEDIQIPERADLKPPAVAPPAPKSGMNPWLLAGSFVLIGLAVAVLVYNLSLRGGPRGPDRTRSRTHTVNRVP